MDKNRLSLYQQQRAREREQFETGLKANMAGRATLDARARESMFGASAAQAKSFKAKRADALPIARCETQSGTSRPFRGR